MAAEGSNIQARQLAGLLVKNALQSKEEGNQKYLHERWKTIDAARRDGVKVPLLAAMRSGEIAVSHTAAQACAEIAAIELPYEEWPVFLPTLLENIQQPRFQDPVKSSSLECLGYTCERISILGGNVNEKSTDSMLNAIVDGIGTNRPDNIRLAAAVALKNSLVFAQKNMDKTEERAVIMERICEAARSNDSRVRAAAYDGIVQIAVNYYDKLQDYMTTIYGLTTNTIHSDEEDVAKAAIEFWTSLCEVEQDLIDEEELLQQQNMAPERPCMRYVAAALNHLAPFLTETLTKQQEDVDEDSFTLQMAGQLCLTSVSQTVEDLVVPVIMPFVEANILNENWKFRDAAIMAFISILDGPGPDAIGMFVSQSIPVLLSLLSDSMEIVRDSAAHCISRICLLHIRFIPQEVFPQLLSALMQTCVEGSPKVSSQSASAIFNLASSFSEQVQPDQDSNSLSYYMQNLLEGLLRAADRPDSDEANLRVASMEAISELITVAAADCLQLLGQLLPAFVQRFDQTFSMSDLNESDRFKREQVQGLLCAVIQSLYRKLDKATVTPMTDKVMNNLLMVLQHKNASCHEECFSAISAISDVMEADFAKYMDALRPLLIAGLRNFEAYQVCIVAVGTVGDISRNIEGRIQPYCDDIMNALVEDLKDAKIHRSVKPPVLSCFGDIAMAIGAAYQPYLDFSIMMLMQASGTKVPEDDEDLVEYLNLLRESILEAYVGIIQGLRDANMMPAFVQYVPHIMSFLQEISTDPNRDDFVLSKAVGLLGDLAQTLGPQIRDQLNQPFVSDLIGHGLAVSDQSTIEMAQWASSIVLQIIHSS